MSGPALTWEIVTESNVLSAFEGNGGATVEGIHSKEHLLMFYFVVVCLASMADMLGVFFLESTSDNDQKATKESKDHVLRKTIKMVFGIGAMLLAMGFMLRYFFGIFLIMALLMFVVITPCIIGDFVKYVFGKTYEYEMTDKLERVLLLCGWFAWLACVAIADETICNKFSQDIYNNIVLNDMLKIVLLNTWYFFVLFFSITCLLIFLHKVYLIKMRKRKNNKKIKKCGLHIREISAEYKWIKKTEKIIDSLPKSKKVKKISLYVFWLLLIFMESIKIVFAIIINYSCVLIMIIIYLIKNTYCRVKEFLKKSIVSNYGQNILIVSRISFVVSIGIVYLLDQYQGLLSASGSSVYEFACSVIIIPFLITQLSEMRKKWH